MFCSSPSTSTTAQHVLKILRDNVSAALSNLSSKNSELNDSFVLLLSHSLSGQLQSTNQIDLSPLLDFRVFAEKITKMQRHNKTIDYPNIFGLADVSAEAFANNE